MKATLDIIRRLRDTTGLKVNRSFGGFFADRLVQAMAARIAIDGDSLTTGWRKHKGLDVLGVAA